MAISKRLLAAIIAAMGIGGPPPGDTSTNSYIEDDYIDDYFE